MPSAGKQRSNVNPSQDSARIRYTYHGPPGRSFYTTNTKLDLILWPSCRTEKDPTIPKTARLKGARCNSDCDPQTIGRIISEVHELRLSLNSAPKENIYKMWTSRINEIASRRSKNSDISIMICYNGWKFQNALKDHRNLTWDVRQQPTSSSTANNSVNASPANPHGVSTLGTARKGEPQAHRVTVEGDPHYCITFTEDGYQSEGERKSSWPEELQSRQLQDEYKLNWADDDDMEGWDKEVEAFVQSPAKK